FTALQPSAHEQAYRLEQWRALDHGIPIRCIVTNTPYRGVDTPEDIEALGSFHDSDQTG
ncbi:MAG: 3-deoxy-manno-octulosonate cytidylyltransferase, partial [Candidatus Neomarinimicrobiota bacterium]